MHEFTGNSAQKWSVEGRKLTLFFCLTQVNQTHYKMMVEDIEANYEKYDAFIVMHGTDTMAYTASALSFMLENLRKTVILTGSQVPFAQEPNDAAHNLLMSLTIAGHFEIPEVCIYFDHKLYRGNRSRKVNALGFDAFNSHNLAPLVKVGTEMKVNWNTVRRPPRADEKTLFHKTLSPNVGVLKLFPGVSDATVRNFLLEPLEGCVLETYGTGNAPSNRPEFVKILQDAISRGVIIVNVTQCHQGTVLQGTYAASSPLVLAGVLSGYDMTTETALAKLSYLLARKDLGMPRIRELVGKNLRGELTTDEPVPFSWHDETFLKTVASALQSESRIGGPVPHLVPLRASTFLMETPRSQAATLSQSTPVLPTEALASSEEPLAEPSETLGSNGPQSTDHDLRNALFPVLLCAAAQIGSVDSISALIAAGATPNCSYDGRTPLHIAAREGHLNATQYLVEVAGANIDTMDRWQSTPLDDALSMAHTAVSDYLRSVNAKESTLKRTTSPATSKVGVVRHPMQQ